MLRRKLHAYRAVRLIFELIFRVPQEQLGLAHTAVAYKDKLEHQLIGFLGAKISSRALRHLIKFKLERIINERFTEQSSAHSD